MLTNHSVLIDYGPKIKKPPNGGLLTENGTRVSTKDNQ
jgi:hypothetical protein